MLIVLEILVTLPFLTLGAQLQQVGVGMFSLLSIVAETLILVGKYVIYVPTFLHCIISSNVNVQKKLVEIVFMQPNICLTTLKSINVRGCIIFSFP